MVTSLIPSYKQGFYSKQRGGIPLYPSLWRGLVGAWCPSLGVTGTTTLPDVSGYGNDGTMTSIAAADWVVGKNGYSITYDGSNDWISIPHSASLETIDATNMITIVQWVNTTDTRTGSTENWCFSQYDGSGGAGKDILVRVQNGIYGIFFRDSGWKTYDGNYNDGGWHLFVSMYDGTKILGYADGIKRIDVSATVSVLANVTHDWEIGTGTAGSIDEFAGKIGDTLIYNRALNPDEIRQLYIDPHALFRQRQMVVMPVAAAAGGAVAPTGNIYGPLYGPLGGVI